MEDIQGIGTNKTAYKVSIEERRRKLKRGGTEEKTKNKVEKKKLEGHEENLRVWGDRTPKEENKNTVRIWIYLKCQKLPRGRGQYIWQLKKYTSMFKTIAIQPTKLEQDWKYEHQTVYDDYAY